MTATNNHPKTLPHRLDAIAQELKQLMTIEDKHRRDAGWQQPHDYDYSAKYQSKKLPTYNP